MELSKCRFFFWGGGVVQVSCYGNRGPWHSEGAVSGCQRVKILSAAQKPQTPPKNVSSWWFQPIWKICSSNWIISPNFRGEHKRYLSCHHLVESGGLWVYLRSFVWQEIMAKNRVSSPQRIMSRFPSRRNRSLSICFPFPPEKQQN